MKKRVCLRLGLVLGGLMSGEVRGWAASDALPQAELSPTALAVTHNGDTLYIGCATAEAVLAFDTKAERVAFRLQVPGSPSGLALGKADSRLYITLSDKRPRAKSSAVPGQSSSVCVADLGKRRIIRSIPVGHTSMAPVLSSDEGTLFVCNRFDNEVAAVDLQRWCVKNRIGVVREPFAQVLTRDGKYLLVANHLAAGRASELHNGAVVTVVDARTFRVAKHVRLPLGANLLGGIAVSPDGRFAAVTHIRAMYWLSTRDVQWGGINCAALSVLDLQKLDWHGTLLLDASGRGAANPWAVAWLHEGGTIVISHAGTHQVSVVDVRGLGGETGFRPLTIGAYEAAQGTQPAFPRKVVRVRERIELAGEGPRAMAVHGSHLYVANYFSDNLSRVRLEEPGAAVDLLSFGSIRAPSIIRRGEMLFNNARLCLQGWQSCASCHDADGRSDGLNWDLLNDGVGNPKNTRSLVWAHQTGPVMALGVRANAETAVRAGLHHILFSKVIERDAEAIDAYLKSLEPMPSPRLTKGKLRPAAERGKRLFMSSRTGCASCHPPPRFTDMKPHDVGTAGESHSLYFGPARDGPTDQFYTPALVELWRTAPYLHDGSAVSMQEVLIDRNPNDRHGHTSNLNKEEIQDLVEYLLSL